jgi:hypothetical protein
VDLIPGVIASLTAEQLAAFPETFSAHPCPPDISWSAGKGI